MPRRTIPLVNNEIYHIYNRSINLAPIFSAKKDCQRTLEILNYYQFTKTSRSFSRFKKLSLREKEETLEKLYEEGNQLVKILCFCLMPNHYHLLLKQVEERGIPKLIANFQNSYIRYFNLKNERLGTLFQGAFKAVRIETDEQLVHVSRYIHLNPYSSLVIKTLKEIEKYPWASFKEYLSSQKRKISSPQEVLSFFQNPEQYKKFVYDQANYQRGLEKIKHIVLE